MKKYLKIGLFIAVLLFIGIQFIPAERVNPPAKGELVMPQPVKEVMVRACYDCHSNDTVWPWYSHIAPVSVVISRHVENGRKHLNFSNWVEYDTKRKAKKLEEIVEEIEEGSMPLWDYMLMHPKSELSEADFELIKNWVKSAAADEYSQKEANLE